MVAKRKNFIIFQFIEAKEKIEWMQCEIFATRQSSLSEFHLASLNFVSLGTEDLLKIRHFCTFVSMQNHLRHELHNIISGKSQVRFGIIIQAITHYLKDGSQSSIEIEDSKQIREKETKRLEGFISQQNLWINDIDFTQYVSEGAEQRVYLKYASYVLKLNDAIYYTYWIDYFHNLLLHNFFFPDTAYELLGFTKENDVIYAVVKQPFVTITQVTDLSKVKLFL